MRIALTASDGLNNAYALVWYGAKYLHYGHLVLVMLHSLTFVCVTL